MLGASWAGIRNRRPTSDELKQLGPGLWLRNALKSFLIFGGAVTGAVFLLGVVDGLSGSPRSSTQASGFGLP